MGAGIKDIIPETHTECGCWRDRCKMGRVHNRSRCPSTRAGAREMLRCAHDDTKKLDDTKKRRSLIAFALG